MHSNNFQRVEKVFSPRCADFETFKKVSKSCLIERAVGFLPPAHTPRCSVASVFCGVFLQPGIFYYAGNTSEKQLGMAETFRILPKGKLCELLHRQKCPTAPNQTTG